MSVGLEVRSPFLAKEIIEFAVGLPASFKITKTEDKIIMRDTFGHVLPSSVKSRSKQGFGSPVQPWMNEPSMKEIRHESFASGAKIYSFLDANFVAKNKDAGGMRGWAMLTLAAWFNR